jgi:hypothetical protein
VCLELKFGSQTLTQYTNTDGKTTFNLQHPSGGGFEGSITLVNQGSAEFYAAQPATFNVNYGSNSHTYEVDAKNSNVQSTQPQNPFDWTWVIVGLMLSASIVLAAALLRGKLKNRERRRNLFFAFNY